MYLCRSRGHKFLHPILRSTVRRGDAIRRVAALQTRAPRSCGDALLCASTASGAISSPLPGAYTIYTFAEGRHATEPTPSRRTGHAIPSHIPRSDEGWAHKKMTPDRLGRQECVPDDTVSPTNSLIHASLNTNSSPLPQAHQLHPMSA